MDCNQKAVEENDGATLVKGGTYNSYLYIISFTAFLI